MTSGQNIFDAIKACETDMAVMAGAGTGKTHALVIKYLGELEKADKKGFTRLDQLAAITFTEKAAAEMKGRVRDKLTVRIEELRKTAGLEGSAANLAQNDPDRKHEARLAAHLILQRQSLQSAYISTIHSFCARLLKENPAPAGVDPNFKVIDENQAGAMLGAATQKVIFGSLRAGDKDVERLALCFGYSRKGQFEKGLREMVVSLIPLMRVANKSPEELVRRYRELAEKDGAAATASIKEMAELLPVLLGYKKGSKEFKTALEIEAVGNDLLSGSGPSFIIAVKALDWADDLEKAINGRKDKSDTDHAGGKRAVSLLRSIASPVVENEITRDVERVASLLSQVLREYGDMKAQVSALDYEDLEERALKLLSPGSAIRAQYAAQFHRVMVDEFQDINALQKEIIYSIAPPGSGKLFIVGDIKQSIYGFRGADVMVFKETADEIENKGGTRFHLVESRRSAPALINFTNNLFSAIMTGGEGKIPFNKEKDSLTPHRSVNPERAGVTWLNLPDSSNAGQARAQEAQALATFFKEEIGGGTMTVEDSGKIRNAHYGDIALLLRRFSYLEAYENAFRLAGVPYSVVRGKGFYAAQEIIDMISLLSFLDNTADSLSLMNVLRSPLVGMSEAGLFRLRRDETAMARPLETVLSPTAPAPQLGDEEDTRKFIRFRERAAKWMKAKSRLTISEMIETLLGDTGYGAVMMSRYQGEQRVGNLSKLIEQARMAERNGAGMPDFIRSLKKLADRGGEKEPAAGAISKDNNRLAIMTIHQSKGLEFPVVALADLNFTNSKNGGRVNIHPRSGIFMRYYLEEEMDWVKGPVYREMDAQAKTAEDEESKRLFYVATTRARDHLIITGGTGSKKTGGWIGMAELQKMKDAENTAFKSVESAGFESTATYEAMPGLASDIINGWRPDPPSAPQTPKQARRIKPFINLTVTELATLNYCPRLYYYQYAMELPGASREVDAAFWEEPEKPAGPDPVELGTRFHNLLEKLDPADTDFENTVESAVNGRFGDMPASFRQTVSGITVEAFSSKPLSRLRKRRDVWITREAPLAIRFSNDGADIISRGTADLFFVDETGPCLVDYKFARKRGDNSIHTFQMEMYSAALMAAYGLKELDCAILYLGGKKLETESLNVNSARYGNIKNSVLRLAELVAAMEGSPEKDWPVIDVKTCSASGCRFKTRCFPGGREDVHASGD
ncbi:MAG: UvrD-helicase domain-containing protein [Nitrospinae bacterium]|nr:UvrD-helicase domain-containing protein [Nitrospinota bacterium]